MAQPFRRVRDTMARQLALTRGLIVSERPAAAPARILAAEPELRGLDLDGLTDPSHCTGSAGALTDRAPERR